MNSESQYVSLFICCTSEHFNFFKKMKLMTMFEVSQRITPGKGYSSINLVLIPIGKIASYSYMLPPGGGNMKHVKIIGTS
jgi:hypothetical protein